MSIAVLEINDAALTIKGEDGRVHVEPGFARLTASGIQCGEQAKTTAWTEPQSHYNQYWQQLGQHPLPVKSKLARHFGDIAFAQLKQLVARAGGVRECLLAIPGSLSNQQLSLLLGMLNALNIKTLAVVDSALGARLHRGSPCVYVDMHQHHTVVTALELRAGELAVASQQVMPELGLLRLHNLAVRAIANQLIETTRFDPLHDPRLEQWLFDNLPAWLHQLQWQEELNQVMATPLGERPFRLRRDLLAAAVGGRLSPLHKFLAGHAELPVVLSHTAGALAGIWPAFRHHDIATPATCVDNCLHYLLPDVAQLGPLRRLTSLPVVVEAVAGRVERALPLHLLLNHRALTLAEPVSICRAGNGWSLVEGVRPDAALVIVQQGGELRVIHRQADLPCQLPAALRPGAVLRVDDTNLLLIEVDCG